jgi:hypothetical protein
MWEGTTLRVMVADRSYGEFYDFYIASPEYFGLTLIHSEFPDLFLSCIYPFSLRNIIFVFYMLVDGKFSVLFFIPQIFLIGLLPALSSSLCINLYLAVLSSTVSSHMSPSF